MMAHEENLPKLDCNRRLYTNQEMVEQRGCVTLWALPFTLKRYYLKAKEELWKLKYFTMQKK